MPIRVTVSARWEDCGADCGGRGSGNTVDSGSYTITITGEMKPSGGSEEIVIHDPASVMGTCSLRGTSMNVVNDDCKKCNPVEVVTKSGSVSFGKSENAVATLQAFMGAVGACYALQLTGGLGPGYETSAPALEERRIISFSAAAPMSLTRKSVEDCGTCSRAEETGTGGFAVSINADMTTRKSGSVTWKSRTHPLDAVDASVIDLGGETRTGPERHDGGKATYTVSWSLGEAEPAALKVREVHFNYDGNAGSALQLVSHADDSEITAPEWTSGGEAKSAAFVRDFAFKVKVINFRNIGCPDVSSCPMGMLAYTHDEPVLTTGDLLRTGKGKCGAWQEFMFDGRASRGSRLPPRLLQGGGQGGLRQGMRRDGLAVHGEGHLRRRVRRVPYGTLRLLRERSAPLRGGHRPRTGGAPGGARRGADPGMVTRVQVQNRGVEGRRRGRVGGGAP